jgi:hypothetical protein
MTHVILASPMLLEEGTFTMRSLSLDEAREWVKTHSPKNFVGHSTVKVLGLEPTTDRAVCEGFIEALTLKPHGRLEFGKEYSVDDILSIGITPFLISKVG